MMFLSEYGTSCMDTQRLDVFHLKFSVFCSSRLPSDTEKRTHRDQDPLENIESVAFCVNHIFHLAKNRFLVRNSSNSKHSKDKKKKNEKEKTCKTQEAS